MTRQVPADIEQDAFWSHKRLILISGAVLIGLIFLIFAISGTNKLVDYITSVDLTPWRDRMSGGEFAVVLATAIAATTLIVWSSKTWVKVTALFVAALAWYYVVANAVTFIPHLSVWLIPLNFNPIAFIVALFFAMTVLALLSRIVWIRVVAAFVAVLLGAYLLPYVPALFDWLPGRPEVDTGWIANILKAAVIALFFGVLLGALSPWPWLGVLAAVVLFFYGAVVGWDMYGRATPIAVAATTDECPGVYTRTTFGSEHTVVNPKFCQLRWRVESGCVDWYDVGGKKLGQTCAGERASLIGQYALQAVGRPAVVSITHCSPRARGDYLQSCS